MHRRLISMLVLLAAAACSGPPPGPSASASPLPASGAVAAPDHPLPSPLPDILARVNGRPVLVRQVVPLAKQILDRVSKDDREKNKPRAMREGLSQFIDRELLFQEAEARGLKADDRSVQYAYDRARIDYPDDALWAEFLKMSGFDQQSYKDEVRVVETIKALLARAADQVAVPDAEVRARYEADPAAFPPPKGKPTAFESVKDQVRARLFEEKRAEAPQRLLASLRAKARIETYI